MSEMRPPAGGRWSYQQSVDFLYSLGFELKSAKFGLEGIQALVDALGHPERAFRSVHVAGTNGKGSTCALIESALREAGLRTALYTSPHLIEPFERIAIGGQAIRPREFAEAFARVHAANERILAAGLHTNHTTFFETVTGMAFEWFRERSVEMAVLEVGLGGRLDATNVVRPDLAVITPIALDHQKILGDTLEAIAGEKAGILKPGVPAVFAPQAPEAEKALRRRAQELGVEVTGAGIWEIRELSVDQDGASLQIDGPRRLQLRVNLRGAHQVTNALTALTAVHRLGIGDRAIEQGFARAVWPGRLEKVAGRPDILLDGAHNPAGAAALASYLRQFHRGRKIWLVFGCLGDKPAAEILDHLAPLAATVLYTAIDHPRAAAATALLEEYPAPWARACGSLAEAEKLFRDAGPGDLVVITGSLFLVGEARRMLLASPVQPGAAA